MDGGYLTFSWFIDTVSVKTENLVLFYSYLLLTEKLKIFLNYQWTNSSAWYLLLSLCQSMTKHCQAWLTFVAWRATSLPPSCVSACLSTRLQSRRNPCASGSSCVSDSTTEIRKTLNVKRYFSSLSPRILIYTTVLFIKFITDLLHK